MLCCDCVFVRCLPAPACPFPVSSSLSFFQCASIRDSAQSELDLALPMLDQAVACLSELNKSHIDEVRNFKKPPSGVVLTMECACIMLRNTLKMKVVMKMDEGGREKKEDYWTTAQKYLLKQPKLLLETLKSYDKNNISDVQRRFHLL